LKLSSGTTVITEAFCSTHVLEVRQWLNFATLQAREETPLLHPLAKNTRR
jgi:hypothetical protein